MESLLNYLAFEIKNKMVDVLLCRAVASGGGQRGQLAPKASTQFFKRPKFKSKATC